MKLKYLFYFYYYVSYHVLRNDGSTGFGHLRIYQPTPIWSMKNVQEIASTISKMPDVCGGVIILNWKWLPFGGLSA